MIRSIWHLIFGIACLILFMIPYLETSYVKSLEVILPWYITVLIQTIRNLLTIPLVIGILYGFFHGFYFSTREAKKISRPFQIIIGLYCVLAISSFYLSYFLIQTNLHSKLEMKSDLDFSSFKDENTELNFNDVVLSDDPLTLRRNKLNEYLGDGYSNILKHGLMVPQFDVQDKFLGFLVNEISHDSFFERCGFKNSDLITEVNGIRIENEEQSYLLFDELMNSPEMSVRFLRENEEKVIEIYIE